MCHTRFNLQYIRNGKIQHTCAARLCQQKYLRNIMVHIWNVDSLYEFFFSFFLREQY